MKQFLGTFMGILAGLLIWNRWGAQIETWIAEWTGGEAAGVPAGAGAPGAPGGVGAPAEAGLAGAPGGVTSLAQVAAALQAIAAGIRIPNIQTETAALAAGTTVVVDGQMGKRIYVLAFSVVSNAAAAAECAFWSGTTERVWRTQTAPSGTSSNGANLATAWPSWLMVCADAEDLRIQVADTTLVSVTYWRE